MLACSSGTLTMHNTVTQERNETGARNDTPPALALVWSGNDNLVSNNT